MKKALSFVNGNIMSQALLDVSVPIKEERGMLGIAVSKHAGKAIYKQTVNVFLYYNILEVDQQVVTIVCLFINLDTCIFLYKTYERSNISNTPTIRFQANKVIN